MVLLTSQSFVLSMYLLQLFLKSVMPECPAQSSTWGELYKQHIFKYTYTQYEAKPFTSSVK